MFVAKLLVLLYFFVIATVAAYATCTLWMAGPKEAPSPSAAIPSECQDVKDKDPQITRLEPDTVAIGENYLGVAVVGCNFTDAVKVRFNGVERTSNAAGTNQLNVPLLASDFAGATNIAVSVETAVSPPADGKTQPRPPRRSNVRNLRIKSPADIKVVWGFLKHDREITLELRLILLVLFVGGFSACVFGLNSFVNYAGEEKLQSNWLWLYFARPVMGAGIAFVFYLIIRAGFLAGTSADSKAVNPFGFVAVAALVGMFSDAAIIKLNDVFDTLFRATDTRSQSLDAPMIDSTGTLPNGTVNQPYAYQFKAKDGTGPFNWAAASTLPAWLKLTPAGALEGTPSATASVTFTVQVKDANGKVAKKECTLEVK
jgi:hypothetical protein